MLRPHGGPQDHLLRNAIIIVGYGMYLNRFLYLLVKKVFGETLSFWQLLSKTQENLPIS